MKAIFFSRCLFLILLMWIGNPTVQGAPNNLLPGPLFPDLGNLHQPITASSTLAQQYFDQGMILLYGFNHYEAIRSFRAAAEVDPQCAMAWWGVAYAYGPNINAPMTAEAVPKAWETLQKALALKEGVTERERAYIDALQQRYAPEPTEDRSALDLAYAHAMRQVAARYPKDLHAGVLFAEALMTTMPWDYWTADKSPKPATEELLAVLRRVLKKDKRHPGANHFYIHAVEAGPEPAWGEASARYLGDFAPGAGHLVHMPSHIYVRVGRYHDASRANEKAVLADETYITQCRAMGFYPGTYYPHNVHFLWFAKTLEGRSEEAIAAARKVAAYALDGRCGVVEGPRLRHLHLLALAQFGRWEDLLAENRPGDEYPLDQAFAHYARALAFLGLGQTEKAAGERDALETLIAQDWMETVSTPIFPGQDLVQVARLVLEGKLAMAQGATDTGLTRLGEAVKIQEAIPYMEPPYWYYPVRQSLGAALIQAGQPQLAEKEFRHDLTNHPRDGRALFGLVKALEGQGKRWKAYLARRQFRGAWRHADVDLNLSWY